MNFLVDACVVEGGVVRVCGRPLTPRVILMTDGLPTDENGETPEVTMPSSCMSLGVTTSAVGCLWHCTIMGAQSCLKAMN